MSNLTTYAITDDELERKLAKAKKEERGSIVTGVVVGGLLAMGAAYLVTNLVMTAQERSSNNSVEE